MGGGARRADLCWVSGEERAVFQRHVRELCQDLVCALPRGGPLGRLAVDETVILLHPPLPLVGVSIVMKRGCQQNDSLVRCYGRLQQPGQLLVPLLSHQPRHLARWESHSAQHGAQRIGSAHQMPSEEERRDPTESERELPSLAPDETGILLHLPLPLVGVSMGISAESWRAHLPEDFLVIGVHHSVHLEVVSADRRHDWAPHPRRRRKSAAELGTLAQ